MLAAYLRDRGVGTTRPYEDVIGGATKHYGYEGDCPAAERLLRQTLVIPSYFKLKPQDIEHIVRSLNQGYLNTGEDWKLPA
jgi:dTDP-4-amino-4,6-dideoxygalactose transaminase